MVNENNRMGLVEKAHFSHVSLIISILAEIQKKTRLYAFLGDIMTEVWGDW